MNKIELLLKALRESAEVVYEVYTTGSCYQLYNVLKTHYPQAVPYWSDKDSHAVVKIDEDFYDIGGKLNREYVTAEQGYYELNESKRPGFNLLRYLDEDRSRGIVTQRYERN